MEHIETVFLAQENIVTGGDYKIFRDYHKAQEWLKDLHVGIIFKFEEDDDGKYSSFYILSEGYSTHEGLQEPDWKLAGDIMEMMLE